MISLVVVVVLNSFSSPRLPGFQLLRDTFAGKIISETRGVKTDSEKWSQFYRQKCRAGVRTKLLFLRYEENEENDKDLRISCYRRKQPA